MKKGTTALIGAAVAGSALLNKASYHHKPYIEQALWFYPDRSKYNDNAGLFKQLNYKEIHPVLRLHYINSIYLCTTYSYAPFTGSSFASASNENQKVKDFRNECNDNGINVHALSLEDYFFLDYTDDALKNLFCEWVDRTRDVFSNYQIDIEPHTHPSWRNPANRDRLIKRFIEACSWFQDITEQFNAEFTPAVAPGYHRLLKEKGFEGLDSIPGHYLSLMSYTRKLFDLEKLVNQELCDVKKNILLGASVHNDSPSPALINKSEAQQLPGTILKLREHHKMIKGYIIFSNLRLLP
ncbi:hypothetical protein JW756_06660 [Candidatus Woesearchaeota archaeon]|nr:hypothetical protein [Candidatus Woesearchaeota archaeon]